MFSSERNRVANKARQIRGDELDSPGTEKLFGKYVTERSGESYIRSLGGLGRTFEVVSGLSSKTVVDIGTGTGKALGELSEKFKGLGLDFVGTVLTRRNLKENGIHKISTTGEVMRGFLPNSVGCIIANMSAMYSASPRLMIDRWDEVLCGGGMVKMNTLHYSKTHRILRRIFGKFFVNLPTYYSVSKFAELFKEKGYDVVTLDGRVEILLAIKTGGSVSASEILESDFATTGQSTEYYIRKLGDGKFALTHNSDKDIVGM